MTNLTDDEVRHIARLSKFKLSDEEIERFKFELAAILNYVEQLQEVDTEGVEPTAQVTGLVNQTRTDEVRSYGVDQAGLLANAPDSEDGSIKVPKVL